MKTQKMIIVLIISIGLILAMLSNLSNTDIESKNSDGVVTILMPYINTKSLDISDERAMGVDVLKDYVDIFNVVNDDGIHVELKYIDTTDKKKFISERNKLLMGDNQPELIFISNSIVEDKIMTQSVDDLVEFGTAMELDGLLEHYDDLYDGLKYDYFLPIGIRYLGYYYNKSVIKSLGFEHKIEMTSKEYREIVDSWIVDKMPLFDWNIYNMLYDAYFPKLEFYNLENQSLKFEIEDIITRLDKIKYYFEEEYISGVKGISYDDFKDLMQVLPLNMVEAMIDREESEDYYLVQFRYPGNYFKGTSVLNGSDFGMIRRDKSFEAIGFVINRNSADIEKAKIFLDYVISPSAQMVWSKDRFIVNEALTGPVNEAMLPLLVEYEKSKQHVLESSMKIRDESYLKIETGEYTLLDDSFIKVAEINSIFKELAEKYIFSDIDERELENQLKILRNKYQFILME